MFLDVANQAMQKTATSSAGLHLSAELFNALLNHMLHAAIKSLQKLSLSCLFSTHPTSFSAGSAGATSSL